MAKKVYELQIKLMNSEPLIWRRFIVEPDILLVDLHRIIMTVMGWTNSHLHQFSHNNIDYAPKEFELENSKDSRITKLDTLLKRVNDSILYEYDFGDGWAHEVILEKIFETLGKNPIPLCIGGERHCPPENCGGVWGYTNLLKIISDPKNEEYEGMLAWLGGKFNPEDFDIKKVNQKLKKKDFGCIWL